MTSAASATSLLGFGFNVYGKLELKSGTTESIINNDSNIDTSPVEEPSTQFSESYSSREELTEQFSASVGIKASGFTFDGEFNAKYGSESESTVGSVYGLYRDTLPLSYTKLVNHGVDNYSSTFATDPNVQNIPSTFTPGNAEEFYRIFRRYGTHFVSSITLGAKLTAYTTAQTSETVTEQDAEVSIKAEYDGLFSASADAGSSWKQVASNWDTSRVLNFESVGGDASQLAGLSTGYGNEGGGTVKDWLQSVTLDTAQIIDYELTDISNVFSSQTAPAVETALNRYFSSLIRVEAWEMNSSNETFTSTVSLPNGDLVTQPHFAFGDLNHGEPSWVWLLLLDPVTLKPLQNAGATRTTDGGKLYSCVDGWEEVIDNDIATVRAHTRKPVVVAAIEYGQDLFSIPAQLQQLSEDCGFDLNKAHNPLQHQIMGFIGTPNVDNAAIVTTYYGDTPGRSDFTVPARSVGQYLDSILVPADQDGIVLSPLPE